MNTSAKAVHFDEDSMWVDLDDGRRMAVTVGPAGEWIELIEAP